MNWFKAKTHNKKFKWHMTYYFADRAYTVSFPDRIDREEHARSAMQRYYNSGFEGQMSFEGNKGDAVINLKSVQYVTLERVEVE
jgi:hypothetical protein